MATLFGPNILHRTRASSEKEILAESQERVEQSKEVIAVVKDMIDHHHDLFEVSGNKGRQVGRQVSRQAGRQAGR